MTKKKKKFEGCLLIVSDGVVRQTFGSVYGSFLSSRCAFPNIVKRKGGFRREKKRRDGNQCASRDLLEWYAFGSDVNERERKHFDFAKSVATRKSELFSRKKNKKKIVLHNGSVSPTVLCVTTPRDISDRVAWFHRHTYYTNGIFFKSFWNDIDSVVCCYYCTAVSL